MKTKEQLEQRLQEIENEYKKLKKEVKKTFYVPTYEKIESLRIQRELLRWTLLA